MWYFQQRLFVYLLLVVELNPANSQLQILTAISTANEIYGYYTTLKDFQDTINHETFEDKVVERFEQLSARLQSIQERLTDLKPALLEIDRTISQISGTVEYNSRLRSVFETMQSITSKFNGWLYFLETANKTNPALNQNELIEMARVAVSDNGGSIRTDLNKLQQLVAEDQPPLALPNRKLSDVILSYFDDPNQVCALGFVTVQQAILQFSSAVQLTRLKAATLIKTAARLLEQHGMHGRRHAFELEYRNHSQIYDNLWTDAIRRGGRATWRCGVVEHIEYETFHRFDFLQGRLVNEQQLYPMCEGPCDEITYYNKSISVCKFLGEKLHVIMVSVNHNIEYIWPPILIFV